METDTHARARTELLITKIGIGNGQRCANHRVIERLVLYRALHVTFVIQFILVIRIGDENYDIMILSTVDG